MMYLKRDQIKSGHKTLELINGDGKRGGKQTRIDFLKLSFKSPLETSSLENRLITVNKQFDEPLEEIMSSWRQLKASLRLYFVMNWRFKLIRQRAKVIKALRASRHPMDDSKTFYDWSPVSEPDFKTVLTFKVTDKMLDGFKVETDIINDRAVRNYLTGGFVLEIGGDADGLKV